MTDSEAEEHIAHCNLIIESLAKSGKENMKKLGVCTAEKDKQLRLTEKLNSAKDQIETELKMLKQKEVQQFESSKKRRRAILGKFAAEWTQQLGPILASWEEQYKLSYEETLKRH